MIVVAAALVCWALVALFLHGRMYSARLGSSPWAFALQGAGLAALVAGAVACLAELRRRRAGAGFVPTFGRGLMAASAVGFACLLAGFAWGMDLLCVQGVERPAPSQMDRVPAFGMVCALLPVGACLSLGRRGRVAVYASCAALVAVGTGVYLASWQEFAPSDLHVPSGGAVTLSFGEALRACAVGLAPRLAALWAGLAVAWWMEAAARSEAQVVGPSAAGAGLGWPRFLMCAVCGTMAAVVAADLANSFVSYPVPWHLGMWPWLIVLHAVEILPIALGLLAVAGRAWPGACLVLAGVMLLFQVLFFGWQDGAWVAALAGAAYLAGSLGMLLPGAEAPGRAVLRPAVLVFLAALAMSAAWSVVFHSRYNNALEAVDPALRLPLAALLAAMGVACLAAFAVTCARERGERR